MKNIENLSEYFDNYLDGTLSKEYTLLFETNLKTDEGFKMKFEAHKAVIDTFKRIGRQELKEELNTVHDELKREGLIEERTKPPFILQKVWAIAAVFIGLIVLTFAIWQPTKLPDGAIFTKYMAMSYPNKFIINTANNISVRGDGSQIRGEESIIENLTSDECEKIILAFKLYDKKDYSGAEILFSEVLVPLEKNYELDFYWAYSQLMSNKIDAAISNLSFLIKVKEYSYKEESQYYLALAYIKKNELSKARQLLHSLKEKGGKYSVKASDILDNLRWF